MTKNNLTFTNFSEDNPAHYPVQQDGDPKFLYNYIEVMVILKKLKNKTSSGLDNIPTIVLKNIAENVIKDYTILFNNAINNSYYPKRWKAAKVLPIPKKGKNLDASQSYRPISLTMSISKIFERLIKKQLDIIIEDKKVIPNNQFGFKRKHATTHAINKLLSDINSNLHNNLIVGTVFLDLEKAFDSVWINGLIYTMVTKSFPIGLIFLIIDMIIGNFFYTWDGKLLSKDSFIIQEGLQQGRVLSPILFNVYDCDTNSAADLESDGVNSNSFADDRVIYVADNSADKIINKLQDRKNKINEHYLKWNLKINGSKSEVIFFRRPCQNLKISQYNRIKAAKFNVRDQYGTLTEIPVKKTVKYLGVTFDHLIHLTKHHKIQLEKARTAIKSNSRIFYNNNLSIKAKLICYQLLIRPLITYAAPMLWNMGPTVMEKYRRLERSALRSCIRKYRKAETNYRERISNANIYNMANITRLDCFYLKLCRNYYASYQNIDNPIMTNVRCPSDGTCTDRCSTGYLTPEMFTFCDKIGMLQNEFNLPIIYHIKRHCTCKKIIIDNDQEKIFEFSKALPKVDIKDNHRLNENYWWLKNDAKYIDEIRKRTTWKQ